MWRQTAGPGHSQYQAEMADGPLAVAGPGRKTHGRQAGDRNMDRHDM